MHPFDIFFVIVIGVTLIAGLWKGLIHQVLSLVGLVVGFFIAVNCYSLLAPSFSNFDPPMAKVIAFMVIFFGILVFAALLGFFLKKVLCVFFLFHQNFHQALGALEHTLIILPAN